MQKLITALVLSLSLSLTAHADSKTNIAVYRYWDFGASQKRDEYQFVLLHLALDKSAQTYGKYELYKTDEPYNAPRSIRELERGDTINIIATPRINNPKTTFTIKKQLFNGLLGYRKLIVRRSDLKKFKQIHSAKELQNLAAGQARDWEDVNIYRYNNYKVVDIADFFSLFPMLAAKRFDYIPLSVVEVDDIMARFPKYAEDFAVVPNLIIYYPFPVRFNISAQHPELVERLAKGMEIAQADGSMRDLFEKYFVDEMAKLRLKNLKVFILKNPKELNSPELDKPDLLPEYSAMK